MNLRIAIVDYDAGNLRNVQKAIERLGYRASIAERPEEVDAAEVVVLPGVGAFADGMARLEERGLDLAIRRAAIEDRKPVLGICLGMQLLAFRGDEGGPRPGLEVLPMTVRRMEADRHGLRLPHIGWNEVRPRERSVLFEGLAAGPDFYFVHSYHAVPEDDSIVAATAAYGARFAAALEHRNVFATQFHPEKSQRYGLALLANFLKHCARACR